MESTAVTTQPSRSSEPLKDVTAAFQPITDETGYIEKQEYPNRKENLSDSEPLTEVTAVFDSEAGHQEEKDKKRREYEATDCCCVYTGDIDPFGMYILCQWIGDCFRGIGNCTDNCFEGCADCLGNCCEGSGGDGSPDGCCSCDGDCLSSCVDCCTCDGGSGLGDCLTGCADCADCCSS